MKLHLMDPRHYSRVEPLFHELAGQHLFCGGVLAGKYPGQIVVDDADRGRSALLIKGGMWCYLGGDAGNGAFNRALSEALAAKQWVGEDAWGLLFINPTDGWREVLNNLIPERRPIVTPRKVYVADAEHFNAPPPLPGGFSLHLMDESLRERVDGELPEDVANVLGLRAGSDDPDRAACGYVAVRERACAAWAMVDCIVGDHGEIGLFTADAYRRRGLAAAVSGATIRYGLDHGLSAIHWDAVTYNAPSIRLAERHGLRFVLAYDQALIVYAKGSYLANVAWDHLDKGEFRATLEVCEGLLAFKSDNQYGHYLAGAAWAGLGDKEKALRYLNEAVDHGWSDVGLLENTPSLESLRGAPEWEALMARMKDNDNP
ncbi:MAG: GNAT family N-acetyltransferase [Anaerolineae bacterium]|nr:GNAT family N-acetyltransferase [Anaerolineae bacterium]